jgi:anaerobic selenocysteine-containing dehydrogenase
VVLKPNLADYAAGDAINMHPLLVEEISWEDAVERIAQKIRKTRDATWIATETLGDTEVPVNRTEAIAFMGGAQNTNEECYLFQKAAHLTGCGRVISAQPNRTILA